MLCIIAAVLGTGVYEYFNNPEGEPPEGSLNIADCIH